MAARTMQRNAREMFIPSRVQACLHLCIAFLSICIEIWPSAAESKREGASTMLSRRFAFPRHCTVFRLKDSLPSLHIPFYFVQLWHLEATQTRCHFSFSARHLHRNILLIPSPALFFSLLLAAGRRTTAGHDKTVCAFARLR
jgi:hypothetical protein